MISERALARTRRAIGVFALWICGLACVCAPAPTRADDDQAYKELVDQALSEFKHRNWPEARVLFRRAHEINPNARTLRGMGVVSFEMRDYVQAVQHLSAALVDTRQPLTEAQRSECDGLLVRARTFVGAYALQVQPATAVVTLDGGALVRGEDGRVLVPFGEHALRATAPGYEDGLTRLNVQGGERGEVSITLLPQGGAAPAPAVGAPVSGAPSAVPVAPAASPAASAPAPEPQAGLVGGGLRYTWVSLGAAAVFGGAAVGLWYLGANELDDLDARCARRADQGNPCERGKTNTDSIERYERLTNASIGLAGAAVIATGLFMALEWPRERKLALRLGPTGMSMRGSF